MRKWERKKEEETKRLSFKSFFKGKQKLINLNKDLFFLYRILKCSVDFHIDSNWKKSDEKNEKKNMMQYCKMEIRRLLEEVIFSQFYRNDMTKIRNKVKR